MRLTCASRFPLTPWCLTLAVNLVLGCGIGALPLFGQTSAAAAAAPEDLRDAVRELREQVQELRLSVAQIRSESAEYRAETKALRQQLSAAQTLLATQPGPTEGSATALPVTPPALGTARGTASFVPAETESDHLAERTAKLEEQYDLLSGKVNEQYQTKVESASKYRVRLSGIVLLNVFGNRGAADNLNFPTIASQPAPGSSATSLGGSIRQSQIGFSVFGPELLGAKTRADLQTDFAGGYSNQGTGITAGIFRLRTGTIRLDWRNTSLIAGQDSLFFSPTSPTSFASLAVPALSNAGNLWNWTPQVHVEHRIALSDSSQLVLQGGVLDPVSDGYSNQNSDRYPQAGQASGVPAFAERTAWTGMLFGQPTAIGVAGYYGRQNYGFGRNVDAWAAMSDWNVPLSGRLSLSGKLYRGRAIAGLGGGAGRSVLFNGNGSDPGTALRPLNVAGGWAQLKYRLNSTLEFNAAFGQENSFANDLRAFPFPTAYANTSLLRNRGEFVNAVWRPRSNLLFSAEYRRLGSTSLAPYTDTLGHLNLSLGVLF